MQKEVSDRLPYEKALSDWEERKQSEEDVVDVDIADSYSKLKEKLKYENPDRGYEKKLHSFREESEVRWRRVIA